MDEYCEMTFELSEVEAHRIHIFRRWQASDERRSRQFDDLERPHDAPSVVSFDSLRRIGVSRAQLIMKCRRAHLT